MLGILKIYLYQFIIVVFMALFLPSAALAANPVVNSFSPESNSNGNSRETNLVLTFDQTVIASGGTLAGTATITLFKSDGSIVEVIGASSGVVTVSTSVVTINPQTSLVRNTSYYVQIADDAFENAGGEQYAGISDTTTWFFRTVGGGAGSAARKARAALLASMPTHYNTEAPSLADVGIYVPEISASSSIQPAASEAKTSKENVGPEEKSRSVSEAVVKALAERASRLLKPSATPLASVTQQFETPLHKRACTRVSNRFAGNQKMIDRINERLQKRFGFECNI